MCALLLTIWVTQFIPAMGSVYYEEVYPYIAYCLSSVSRLVPFSIGELFIAFSIAGLLFVYPIYLRCYKKKAWKHILLNSIEYLAWVYVWFYIAWGLNYSQPNFYQRTNVPYTPFNQDAFMSFVNNYIEELNACYVDVNEIDEEQVRDEAVAGYNKIGSEFYIHAPFHKHPKAKRMIFTPLMSKVGVSGSMGPFFCEFTINGDVLPSQYPATYTHELAHLLGITSEAEASFYAYLVCTNSQVGYIRFCGYLSVMNHVLSNAYRLMAVEDYEELIRKIRPEIIELAKQNNSYWMEKYSPVAGDIQNWIYDLYLKGNKIQSGRKNYSEVVGLLISYHTYLADRDGTNKSIKAEMPRPLPKYIKQKR